MENVQKNEIYLAREKKKGQEGQGKAYLFFPHENVNPVESEAESVFFSSLSKPSTGLGMEEVVSKYFWMNDEKALI